MSQILEDSQENKYRVCQRELVMILCFLPAGSVFPMSTHVHSICIHISQRAFSCFDRLSHITTVGPSFLTLQSAPLLSAARLLPFRRSLCPFCAC